jgi:CheY-like chemotaxis protein
VTPPPALGRGETVLLADDEPAVLELARLILAQGGYRVLTAGDGAAAVEAFRAEAGRVGVVVLDATMPGLSGRQAFDAIRRIDPAARVLFASGYQTPEAGLAGDPAVGHLDKPYGPAELTAAVRKLLDWDRERPTQVGRPPGVTSPS